MFDNEGNGQKKEMCRSSFTPLCPDTHKHTHTRPMAMMILVVTITIIHSLNKSAKHAILSEESYVSPKFV